ncbi:MAG TPA: hypothetical protein VK633_10410 [Verrucomicrobiae bacterium]|nr:hypothetical protein [Verrucomicrobiae bacterium]
MVAQVTETAFVRGKLELPNDLADWIEAATLLETVEQLVEGLDWFNPQIVEFLAAHPDFKPKQILILLLYAYARGVYEADEVSQLPYRDELMRTNYAPITPPGNAVTRFRRDNRGLIKWGLVELFKRVLTLRQVIEGTHFPAGLRRHLVVLATRRLDMARTMIRGSEEA